MARKRKAAARKAAPRAKARPKRLVKKSAPKRTIRKPAKKRAAPPKRATRQATPRTSEPLQRPVATSPKVKAPKKLVKKKTAQLEARKDRIQGKLDSGEGNQKKLQRRLGRVDSALNRKGQIAAGRKRRPAQAKGAKKVKKATGRIKNPKTAMNAELVTEDYESGKQINYQNPDYTNPFGSQETTLNEDGTVSVEQKLSDEQQQILDKEQGLTNIGLDYANQQLTGGGFNMGFNPNLANRMGHEDFMAERQRIENDVYGRLTRDLETDYQEARKAKEQELYNRGIALDPQDPTYQRHMKELDDTLSRSKLEARQTATQMGGDEWQRSFGIQETLRGNQFSEQQGIRNQQLGEIGTLQGFGSGLVLPEFQQYQGPNYDLLNPTDIHLGFKGADQADAQLGLEGQKIAIAQQQANRPPAGPPQDDPFNNTPPPGSNQ